MRAGLSCVCLSACFGVGLTACGGKLVPSDGSAPGDAGVNEPAAAAPTAASPPAPPSPSAGAGARDCAPAVMTSDELGTIDVSRLGCGCAAGADCGPGGMCIEFAGLAEARCAYVTDPCSLVTCSEGACIPFFGAQWVEPTCVR